MTIIWRVTITFETFEASIHSRIQNLLPLTTASGVWPNTVALKERVPLPFARPALTRKSHPETADMTTKRSYTPLGRHFCSSPAAPGTRGPVEPIFLSRLARPRMEHLYKKEQTCFCSNWNRHANSSLLK